MQSVDRFFTANGREFFEGATLDDYQAEDARECVSQNQQEHDLVLFFGEDDPDEWKGEVDL